MPDGYAVNHDNKIVIMYVDRSFTVKNIMVRQ